MAAIRRRALAVRTSFPHFPVAERDGEAARAARLVRHQGRGSGEGQEDAR